MLETRSLAIVRKMLSQALLASVGCLWMTACGSDGQPSVDGGVDAGAPGDAAPQRDASNGYDAGGGAQGDAASSVDARSSGDAASGTDATPGADARVDGGGGPDAHVGDGSDETLSMLYPGDLDMGDDPAVVWFEDFEEGSIDAITARYDQVRNNGRMSLVSDTPSGTGSALALRAGGDQDAVDLYKRLPNADEWYVRWYVRYEAGVPWHHSGMWFGGYRPPSNWPSPGAGTKPDGDDRFSIAVEPVFGGPLGERSRFDFYNYWRGMHSWMAVPDPGSGTAYYGNALVHQNDFTVDAGQWVCLEVHARLNPDPSNARGAVLEVWKADVLVQRFDEAGPDGYWIRDKFCPEGADGEECTDYPAPANEVLDLQFRTTRDLALNAFWPQNYITEGDALGTMSLDQMAVATRRIGCMR